MRVPAPKVARPAPPAGKVATLYAERIARALLGGSLTTVAVCEKSGISYPTASKHLKGRPDWFQKTGTGVATRWELTQAGRQAVQSAREG